MEQQQPSIEALQQELEALKPNQPKPIEPSETVSPGSTHAAVEKLKSMFGDLIGEDKQRDWHAESLAHAAAINAVEKACPECYRRQKIGNVSCELCHAEPKRWLPSQDDSPQRDRTGNLTDDLGNVIAGGWNMEQAYLHNLWRKWAATTATMDELKNWIKRSCFPTDKWKNQHAAKILRLHGESVPKTFHGEEVVADEPQRPQPKPEPQQGITDRQVKSAIRYCDLQIAKLDQELADLRKS